MKKIIWISIIGIWTVIIGITLIAYLAAPPKDQYFAVKAYAQVARDYLNKKPIRPEKMDVSDPNMQYVQYVARYFEDYQDAEKNFNSVRRRVKVVIEPQNLMSIESINRGLTKLEEYDIVVQKITVQVEESAAQMIANTKSIPYNDTFFNADELEKDTNSEAAMRKEVSDYRILLGQYFRAVLEFVKSREGYYHVDNSRVVFDDDVDQKYYYKLLSDIRTYENKIDTIMNQEKADLRLALQKLNL